MSVSQTFKIAYVGGGSQYVIPVLNGLASRSGELKDLGRAIELSLFDRDARKAHKNRQYAEIVARETGLPLSVTVGANRAEALQGSDWVIFGIGFRDEFRAFWVRYRPRLLNIGETGARIAMEAAVAWPRVRQCASEMSRLCPNALFCTFVNPPDVLAGAVENAWSLSAVGLCVEAPQLRHWLSYYLQAPYAEVEIEYLGLNHLGWVSRWTVEGREGSRRFASVLRERMKDETWQPETDWFVDVFEATGYLRTGPYHPWPYVREWTDAHEARRRRYAEAIAALRAPGPSAFEVALERGVMIREGDPMRTHPSATAYAHPSLRHSLGALAVGLAGGSAGPAAVQARNGNANPTLPAQAWLEAPTRIDCGRIAPQTVPPLPDRMIAEMRALAHQRMLLAEWLSTGRSERLKEALMLWPNVASTSVLAELAEELPGFADRAL